MDDNYEIHITVEWLNELLDHTKWKKTCKSLGVKPLCIQNYDEDLNTVSNHVMTSSKVRGTLQSVVIEVDRIIKGLQAAGYTSAREKIESSTAHSLCPNDTGSVEHLLLNHYFEKHWKFKRLSNNTPSVEGYKLACSRNVFSDSLTENYLTYRSFKGTSQDFYRDCNAITQQLVASGVDVILQDKAEFVLLDTNTALDKGWLENNTRS